MKKIFSIILTSLIVTLVGCSGETVAQTPPAPQVESPAEEPTPEPEPVEVVVEEPTPEPEPTEAEIVADVLASSEYQEDGAFSVNRYIESLNYKFYDEEDFSIIIDGTEYFMWFEDKSSCMTIAYTDGEKCYRADVVDNPESERTDVMDLKVGAIVTSHSKHYVEDVVARLRRLASGDITFKDWTSDGLSYGYFQYNSEPKYFDVGYIKASEFANKDEDSSFIILYNE